MNFFPRSEVLDLNATSSRAKVACAVTLAGVFVLIPSLAVGCTNAAKETKRYDHVDMVEFPVHTLMPTQAVLTGSPGHHTIEVHLKEFELDGETIDTIFRLDWIDGLPGTLSECVGRRFEFPVNPDEGYVDGSIYLGHRHHPADLTRLAFEERDGLVLARFKIRVRLSFEGLQDEAGNDYDDFDMDFLVPITQE